MNFSYQISNLVLVLIALKVSYNEVESRKITSLSKAVESSTESGKSLNLQSEKFLTGSEASQIETSTPTQTALDTKSEKSRGSTVYSYFYVGRWTWHIPLWFTLWFTFYIAFNVVRSIYSHSVRT